jgi:hypothetical protein
MLDIYFKKREIPYNGINAFKLSNIYAKMFKTLCISFCVENPLSHVVIPRDILRKKIAIKLA